MIAELLVYRRIVNCRYIIHSTLVLKTFFIALHSGFKFVPSCFSGFWHAYGLGSVSAPHYVINLCVWV